MPSKTKKLNFIIPLVIYPFDIMVSIAETNDEIDARFKKLNVSAEDIRSATITSETVRGRTVMFQTNQTLIRIVDFPVTPTDWGNLIHEVFHAVTFIMDRIGMKLQVMKSDEAYAYLMGYISTEMFKRIK